MWMKNKLIIRQNYYKGNTSICSYVEVTASYKYREAVTTNKSSS